MKERLTASAPGSWLHGGGTAAVTTGTVRTQSLEQTRARLEPLLAKRGITRVADLTGLDVLGIPVFSAIRPGAATLAASAGKGLDTDSAWISAVMESLEVRAAESFSAHGAVQGRAAELGLAYGVQELNLHPVSLVDDSTVLGWTPALNLRTGTQTLVPSAAVGLRGWTEERWAPPTFVTTSNGLAAGNDPVEAIVHGLLELVERDALSRADRHPRTAVAAAALGERMERLAQQVESTGATVELEQLESLGGTATFLCYLSQEEMPQLFGGSGCHVDPRIAAERALLEAVQSRASVISGLRDDIPAWSYHGALAAAAVRSPRKGTSLALPPAEAWSGTLRDTLDSLVAHISQRTGRPVLAVDLTPTDEPFPTIVQVFAPGLQPSPEAPRPRDAGESHR